MNKFLHHVSLSITALLAVSCADTPNDISMNVTQGTCVESSQYNVTPPEEIDSNPSNAPYCASVTISNNNSGNDANNIQIISSGLTLNYTINNVNYSGTLYDSTAAGIEISGLVESVGNVVIYDPQNCATTQGSNVVVINNGGGQCTFYLQLSGESFPVGQYPMSLSYNYTNGNENFSISQNINQNVNLFAGGTSGAYQYVAPNWESGPSDALSAAITTIISDVYGDLYIASGSNVYMYNGNTSTQLGSSLPSAVNSLALDANHNLYAGTNSNGIFLYANESDSVWSQITDSNNNISTNTSIIGLQGYEGYINESSIYTITASSAFQCTTNDSTVIVCNALTSNSPSNFYQNSLAIDSNNNLYSGNNTNANLYSPSQWTEFDLSPAVTGQVYGIDWFLSPTNSNQFLYLGQINAESSNESSAYACTLNGGLTCTPIISTANNSITGNIRAVTTDGANNVYVVGNNLNSADFSTEGVSGAYIAESGVETTSTWTAITGNVSGYLQTVKVSSMLAY